MEADDGSKPEVIEEIDALPVDYTVRNNECAATNNASTTAAASLGCHSPPQSSRKGKNCYV